MITSCTLIDKLSLLWVFCPLQLASISSTMQPTHGPLCSLTSSLPWISLLSQSTSSESISRTLSLSPRTILFALLPVHFPQCTNLSVPSRLPSPKSATLSPAETFRTPSFPSYPSEHPWSVSVITPLHVSSNISPLTRHIYSWLYPKPNPLPPPGFVPSWEIEFEENMQPRWWASHCIHSCDYQVGHSLVRNLVMFPYFLLLLV